MIILIIVLLVLLLPFFVDNNLRQPRTFIVTVGSFVSLKITTTLERILFCKKSSLLASAIKINNRNTYNKNTVITVMMLHKLPGSERFRNRLITA